MKILDFKKIIFLITIQLGTFANCWAESELKAIDTLFSKQWAVKNIGQTIFLQDSDLTRQKLVGIPGFDLNYIDTSKIQTDKKELIVAVIDSGIDLTHPDLQGKIWYNEKLCLNAPNAKNLPCNGFNFLDNNTSLLDDVGHGTHVAGLIAAVKNNIGIMGAADPRVKIMPLKVINSTVNGFVYNGKLITDVIADAMIFAIKNGAEVINLSLGWPKIIDTPKVRAAFQMAEEQNVTVIAASGNNNKDLPTFPCSYESVICVGAHDNQGHLTDFSNHGAKVDLVAPGEYIISTFPTSLESRVLRIKNYEVKRGSSQAAPFVTASIADLKLLRPGLSNDQVRSLLFRSLKKDVVSPLSNNKDARFVKFGSLDQTKLINLALSEKIESQAFINPLIKNLTEVKFKMSDSSFQFTIPLKNISAVPFEGRVCLKVRSTAIRLASECQEGVGISAHGLYNFVVQGKIENVKEDSQINFDLMISESIFPLSAYLSRDLNNDSELKSIPVIGGSFDDMGVINNGRRLSRMMKVIDKHQQTSFPEYIFLEKAKQTSENTTVSLLRKENENFVVKNLIISKSQILSIHHQDINLDGKLDYMLYVLSGDKKNLHFYFYNNELAPLFGNHSHWIWPLSTFEGLPVEGGIEKFDWVKIRNKDLGNLLVPTFSRSYSMPEEDNSKNILDRITSNLNHQFYLNPVFSKDDVSVTLRVIDSVSTMKRMRKDLNISDAFVVDLLRSIPVSSDEYQKGLARLLFIVSNGEETKYVEMITNADGISYHTIDSSFPLQTATLYSVFDIDQQKISSENIFSTLLNRSRANFVLRDEGNVDYAKDLINNWENPIISLIGAFKTSNNHYFLMENRYTVSFFDRNGTFKYELPVYRDSSFPGQNFSETLMPVVTKGRPGVYVNSSLIFGERIYSMIGTENGLIRPIGLSLNSPDGCIPLNPEYVGNKDSSSFLFICTDINRQLSIKYLPMSQI